MTISFVTSAKGGCGKSTFSYQFLAPYLFNRSGNKPLVFNLDRANKEDQTYSKSSILDSMECKFTDFDPDVFATKRNLIFDTGATTLAEQALFNFESNGYLDQVDKFFIPVSLGKQASSSAIETYQRIKKYKADAKICFVLNAEYLQDELPLEIQFTGFLEDTKHFLSDEITLGQFNELKKSDPKVRYIVIHHYPCLYWSTHLNLTAYEYASRVNDLTDKWDKVLEETQKDPSLSGKLKLINNRLRLSKWCRNFKEKLETETFKQLDEVFNV